MEERARLTHVNTSATTVMAAGQKIRTTRLFYENPTTIVICRLSGTEAKTVTRGVTSCHLTFGVEGPLGSVVLVQVDPLLLAQPADLLVELPGDVDISSGDRPGDALGPEEPVDLGRRREDAVVRPGGEHELHVGPGQVEVTRG